MKPTTVTHPVTRYRNYTRKQSSEKRPVTDSTIYGQSSYSWTDQRTGGNCHGWRQRIRLGMNATTDLTGSRKLLSKKYGLLEISYSSTIDGNVSKSFYGDITYASGAPNHQGIDTAEAENKAKQKLVKRIIEAQQSFAGTTFLAELGETLHMIRKPVKALREGVTLFGHDVKRRLLKKKNSLWRYPYAQRAAAVGDILAGTWLEKQYGIDPLLSDVDSAMKALAESQILHRRQGGYVKGRAIVESSTMGALQTHPGSPSYVYSRWNNSNTFKSEVIFRAAVRLRYRAEKLPAYNQIFGFRAKDIIPGIYEGIPYSFLLDYFSNANEVVNAYSLHESDVMWCNRTIRREHIIVTQGIGDLAASKVSVEALAGGIWKGGSYYAPFFKFVSSDVNRTAVYSGSLVPTFEVELPNSVTKWANIGALAWLQKDLLKTIRGVLGR